MTTSAERHLRRLAYTRAKVEQNGPDIADWRSIQATEIREAHADGVSVAVIATASGLDDESVRKRIRSTDLTS